MRNLLFFVLFIFTSFLYSQNENSKWCFGSSAGLDFMFNPPVFLPGTQVSSPEGTSSIADAAGNLLFYTDGVNVYNAQNTQMANSNPPLTGGANKQGTLIVKQPGNNSIYYIFVASFTGCRYSIVDMSLAAGAGSITVKNVVLTTTTQAYKVAGTRHCNGTDMWIVTQDAGSTTWRAYLLTAAGLNAPILSNTTNVHDTYAALKFSPDGNKLASTEWGYGVRLYDFNKSTGQVSNLQIVSGQDFAAWGVEFSPDGSKLYAIRGPRVLQWDLNAGSLAAIVASQYTVYAASPQEAIFGALQLGIDGKIYCARGYANYLSVINNPNVGGAACNFAGSGPLLGQANSAYGLPNQVKPGLPVPAIGFTVSNTLCSAASFSLVSAAVSATFSSFSWNFGDPASGVANTSSQNNPTHQFSSLGTYTVQLLLNSTCGITTVSQTVTVNNIVLPLTTSGNATVCAGSTATLSASGANSYQWYSPSGQIGNSASVAVTPTASGIYTVQGNFSNAGCSNTKTLEVIVDPGPSFTVSGDFNLCDKETTTLTATGAVSYSWTGNNIFFGTQPSLVLTPLVTTSYTIVAAGGNNNCTATQVVTVTVNAFPLVTVAGNLIICAGQNASLTGIGATSYTWTTGSGSSFIAPVYTLAPSVSDNFTLTGLDASGECAGQTSFNLLVDPCLSIAENQNAQDILLFPNPFHAVITLLIKTDVSVEVFDVNSRLIMRKDLQAGTQLLDLGQEADGLYLIHLSGEKESRTWKVLKQNY